MALVTNLVKRSPLGMHNICWPGRNSAIYGVSRQNSDTAKCGADDKENTHKIKGNPSFEKKLQELRVQNHSCSMMMKGKEDIMSNSAFASENIHSSHLVSNCLLREMGNFPEHTNQKESHGLILSRKTVFQGCRRYLSTSGHKDRKDLDAIIDMMAPEAGQSTHCEFVHGKGPPPQPPTDCCLAGCVDCVWLDHLQKLQEYYPGETGKMKALAAIDSMEDPQLKLFLKIELGL